MDNHGGILKFFGMLFILFLIAVGIGGLYLYKTFLAPVPVSSAVVTVESGEVRVNDVQVTENQELNEGDVVKTVVGRAVVELGGSITMRLQDNTSIIIGEKTGDHPKVSQIEGITWNHFTGFGDVTGFTITQGDNTATVQGTVFEMGENIMTVAEGSVAYTRGETTVTATAGQVVDSTSGEPTVREGNAEDRTMIRQRLQEAIRNLQEQRQDEINRQGLVIDQLKKRFDITDEQIAAGLREADEGRRDVSQLLGQLPVVPAPIRRIADLTIEIQRLNQQLSNM